MFLISASPSLVFSVELLGRQLDTFAPSGSVTQVRWDTVRTVIHLILTCCGVLGLRRGRPGNDRNRCASWAASRRRDSTSGGPPTRRSAT